MMHLMNKRIPKHDFKGLADWVPVFRAGTQTDSQGRSRVWTVEDLDQIAANHDPDHPAPHVITHQELYSPFAYARTAELKREGDALYAKSRDIEPQFEKLIRDGRLYERSVRLLQTDKGWKLGHIAWLGAEPPAVEGLAPVQFAANADAFDYAVDAYTPGVLARMLRRMREFLIEKFGVEQADRVMPDWEVESLNEHATRLRDEELDSSPLHPSFSAPTPGDQPMPFSQADIDRAREEARQQAAADFSQREQTLQQQLAQERRSRRGAEFQALITGRVDTGHLTPAQAEGAVEFMQQLSDAEDARFEFSAGAGDKAQTVKKSPLEWFSDFMKALPKQVDTRESSAGAAQGEGGAHSFNAPAGAHVDADRLALHTKALDYQRKHNVDYITAIKAVEKE